MEVLICALTADFIKIFSENKSTITETVLDNLVSAGETDDQVGALDNLVEATNLTNSVETETDAPGIFYTSY